DSLIGPVTALAQIPYSDGEQIVVAASEPLPDSLGNEWDSSGVAFGHLYRFGGDELELLSDQRLLEYYIAYDYFHDYRNVTKLSILPEMLDAEEHPVLAAWNIWRGGRFMGYYDTGFLGFITDEDIRYSRIGVPVEMEVFQDVDDNTLVALGWHTWEDGHAQDYGDYTCGLTLLDANLQEVNSLTFAEYSFINDNHPDRRPELLGMAVVQSDDQPSIFVAYSDSSHAFICEMSVPDLDVIRTRALPDNWRGGQMLSLKWEGENLSISNLLLIDSQGSVLVFDPETLVQIEDGSLPEPYVASLQTDIDGDGNPELVTLTRDRLTCYSIAPLATPQDQSTQCPTSLILTTPYPNPFNSSFRVDYQLAKKSPVKLYLYTISGTKVWESKQGIQSPGNYQLIMNGYGLASGVYLLKLESDYHFLTRKVTLIR
ncbi:MAG: T9SS type A sorting domain-containing protein, partial [Calditrichaeota bacterium]|nr:T9SS type A sorting domain-containing protein [Calditrichota bacterium]